MNLSEDDLALLLSGHLVITDGGWGYYNDAGQLHRVGGPAVTWADGTQEWYLDGKRHRLDGPAVTWADGTQEWYLDGKLHRISGNSSNWFPYVE